MKALLQKALGVIVLGEHLDADVAVVHAHLELHLANALGLQLQVHLSAALFQHDLGLTDELPDVFLLFGLGRDHPTADHEARRSRRCRLGIRVRSRSARNRRETRARREIALEALALTARGFLRRLLRLGLQLLLELRSIRRPRLACGNLRFPALLRESLAEGHARLGAEIERVHQIRIGEGHRIARHGGRAIPSLASFDGETLELRTFGSERRTGTETRTRADRAHVGAVVSAHERRQLRLELIGRHLRLRRRIEHGARIHRVRARRILNRVLAAHEERVVHVVERRAQLLERRVPGAAHLHLHVVAHPCQLLAEGGVAGVFHHRPVELGRTRFVARLELQLREEALHGDFGRCLQVLGAHLRERLEQLLRRNAHLGFHLLDELHDGFLRSRGFLGLHALEHAERLLLSL